MLLHCALVATKSYWMTIGFFYSSAMGTPYISLMYGHMVCTSIAPRNIPRSMALYRAPSCGPSNIFPVEGNEMTKRFSLFDLAHEVPSRIYPVVEYVITLDVNDDNDVVTLEKLDIGGRNETYALKEGIPFSKDPDSKWAKTVQYETEKHCLANLLQWLDGHVTIVHIPDKDVNGVRIPIDIIGRLIRIASKQFGFPLATASGYTAGSYEFVHEPEFWRLVKYLNKKTDVYDVLNYLGRIFTDISKDGMFQHDQLFVPLPSDGRDGNVPCDPAVSSTPNDWIIGKNGQMKLRANLVQISGIAIDKRHDLRAIGKGTIRPERSLLGTSECEFDTNQVKIGKTAKALHWFIGKHRWNDGSKHKVYISCEPTLLLQNNRAVRGLLSSWTEREVREILDLLTAKNRVALLERLGGLKLDEDGELEESQRAAIDALRSNIPWCYELEHRLALFCVRLLVKHVIPSAGICGWSSVAYQTEEYGVDLVDRLDPKFANMTARQVIGHFVKAMAIRVPTNGFIACVFLEKDPYVPGKGHVVKPRVMTNASGDSDADNIIVITDPVQLRLFWKWLDPRYACGIKPEKVRRVGPINMHIMQDYAIRQRKNAWGVGTATLYSWKLGQAGHYQASSIFADLANQLPVDRKYEVMFGTDNIMTYLNDQINKWRDTLDGITLQWHDLQQKALGERVDVRTLAKPEWLIAHPNSVLDTCWNGGIKGFIKWADGNQLDYMSMSNTVYTIFGNGPEIIGGEAAREKWDIIKTWGKYWSEAARKDEDGKTYFVQKDNSPFLKSITAMGEIAAVDALRSLATWIPRTGVNDGFGAKWYAIFCANRGVEVFGMWPEVELALIEKQKRFGKRVESAAEHAIAVSQEKKIITLKEVNKEEFMRLVEREKLQANKHKAAVKLYKGTGIIS